MALVQPVHFFPEITLHLIGCFVDGLDVLPDHKIYKFTSGSQIEALLAADFTY